MADGWVKLHRQAITNGWLRNPVMWTFWCYCLMKASHQEVEVTVGYQRVPLKPGQFVFGRKQAASDLGITENVVRTCTSALISTNNITIKTTNKFSIITVVNWHTYQSNEEKYHQQNHQQNHQQLTNNSPTTHHIQEGKEGKEGKEKKEKKQGVDFSLPAWVPVIEWAAYVEMRKKIKKPMTAHAMSLAIGKLETLKGQGNDPVAVLNQSIMHSWQGLFALKQQEPVAEQSGTWKTGIFKGGI